MAWIPGSLDPTRLDLPILKGFQTNVYLAWIPGSQIARFANFKGFQTLTIFLAWIPGSNKARFLNLKGLETNDCLFDLDPWIPKSSDASELISARLSWDSAQAGGFSARLGSARLGSARLVRFLCQLALQKI